MATYAPIINVDISVNTSSSVRVGFGTPIFATAHRAFEEKIRLYSDLDDVAVDFTTDSNTYLGMQSLFSQNPSVAVAMVGRREADAYFSLPDIVAVDDVFTLDIATKTTTSSPVSYTAVLDDEAFEVFTDLQTQLDALIGSTGTGECTITVEGVGGTATLKIVDATDADFYQINSTSENVLTTYIPTDDANSLITALTQVNDDWYFFTAEDHTEEFILAAAASIEPRKKLYFYSLGDDTELDAPVIPITGISDKLKVYTRTVGIFKETADTNFPELAYLGRNAPYDAGSVTWANLQLAGVDASKSSDGYLLTTNQKNNLSLKNMNYVERDGGIDFTRTGVTANGEWIDTIRGVDWLEAEITTSLRNLLVNQAGGKVSFTDAGINQVKNVLDGSLQAGVNRSFLSSYVSVVPRAKDISFADKAARNLKGVTFTAILEGAIHTVEISGTVSYE